MEKEGAPRRGKGSLSIAAAYGCSGAAVLRPKPSEARVAFIRLLAKPLRGFARNLFNVVWRKGAPSQGKRRAFKKNSLASLEYRRSTAAPLHPTLPLCSTTHLYGCNFV